MNPSVSTSLSDFISPSVSHSVPVSTGKFEHGIFFFACVGYVYQKVVYLYVRKANALRSRYLFVVGLFSQ